MSKPTDEQILSAMELEADSTSEDVLAAIAVAEALARWTREHVAYIRSLAASWIGENGPIDLIDGSKYIASVKRTEKIRDQGFALDEALTRVGGDFTEFSKLLKSGCLLPGRCESILGEDFRRDHFRTEVHLDEHGAPSRVLAKMPAKKGE